MVVFLLELCADFENVEKLACSEHQRFSLDLQQSDGTETRCGIVVSDEEEVELAGSKASPSREERSASDVLMCRGRPTWFSRSRRAASRCTSACCR